MVHDRDQPQSPGLAGQDLGHGVERIIVGEDHRTVREARQDARRFGAGGVVFGHHSGVRGAELIGDEQLVLATSFGLNDEDKRMLVLDLSARYASARALRPGQELRPLYD